MSTRTVRVPSTRLPLKVGTGSTNFGTSLPFSGVWARVTDADWSVPRSAGAGAAVPALSLATSVPPHPAAISTAAARENNAPPTAPVGTADSPVLLFILAPPARAPSARTVELRTPGSVHCSLQL